MSLANTVGRLAAKYPGRVPVIVSGAPFTKTRFLCPGHLTVGMFLNQVRQYVDDVRPTDALFVLTNRELLPCVSATLMQLYTQHATDEDPVLRLHVCVEHAFGVTT